MFLYKVWREEEEEEEEEEVEVELQGKIAWELKTIPLSGMVFLLCGIME